MSERKEEDLRKKGRERIKRSQDETVSGKIWKMALPCFDLDAELVTCRRSSGEAEAEREAEVPVIIIVSDAVEDIPVDLDGKSLLEEQKDKHCRVEAVKRS